MGIPNEKRGKLETEKIREIREKSVEIPWKFRGNQDLELQPRVIVKLQLVQLVLHVEANFFQKKSI